jgi:hypothetical protein
MTYIKRVAIAVDQLLGTVFLGQYPDETISAATHRRGWKRLESIINWIMRDPNHCALSYISEMRGTQNAKEYR